MTGYLVHTGEDTAGAELYAGEEGKYYYSHGLFLATCFHGYLSLQYIKIW